MLSRRWHLTMSCPLLKMTRVMLGQVGVRSVEPRLRKPFCRVVDGIDEILGRNEQWL